MIPILAYLYSQLKSDRDYFRSLNKTKAPFQIPVLKDDHSMTDLEHIEYLKRNYPDHHIQLHHLLHVANPSRDPSASRNQLPPEIVIKIRSRLYND